MAACKLKSDLELARMETTFWESCQAVRASSVALYKIHAFLMKELLDLEADKRRSLSQRVSQMEDEVAEIKTAWQDEVVQLKEQLQTLEEARSQPQHVTPSSLANSSPVSQPVNPPLPSLPEGPSPPSPSPLQAVHPRPTSEATAVEVLSLSSLIPAPELVEVSDIRTDTTSGEESGGAERVSQGTQQGHRGRKTGRGREALPSRKKVAKAQGVQLDRAQGSTGEESDTSSSVPSKRKRRRKLVNLTVTIGHPASVYGEGTSEGTVSMTNGQTTVQEDCEIIEISRQRGRGRGRGRGRSRGRSAKQASLQSNNVGKIEAKTEVELEKMDNDRRPTSYVGGHDTVTAPTASSDTGQDKVEGDAEGQDGGEETPSRGRGRKRRGSSRGRRRGRGRAKRTVTVKDVVPTTDPGVGGTDEVISDTDGDIPIVVVTVPHADDTTAESQLTNDGERVGERKSDQRQSLHIERSTSPEIPLQNSQNTSLVPEVAAEGGEGTASDGRGQGKVRSGSDGRLLERIVSTLVERSHSGAGMTREARRGGGVKRKTITARKPSQQLSLVDKDEEHRLRRKRVTVHVNTAGFTAPKLKTGTMATVTSNL